MWDAVPRARPRLDDRAAARAHARSIRGSCGSSPRSPSCGRRRRTSGLRRARRRPAAHAEARRLRRRRSSRWRLGDQRERGPRAARWRRSCKPVYKRVDTCAAEFESFTPYLYSTYEPVCESNPNAAQQGRHPRQRPEPHRAGHRVRLLLLSRRLRAARRGLRDGDDQLQPGDGLDRLRHRRPAVLPAADVRRRDGGDRDASGRPAATCRASCSSAARRRSSWRWRCRKPASRSSAPRPTRSTSPRIASASRRCSSELGHPAAGQRHRDLARRSARGRATRSASRWSCGRRTCSAAAAWRSSTTSARSIAT